MTAQQPENLIIEHPRVEFGGRSLYHICVGDNVDELALAPLPAEPELPDDNGRCTGLYRGYVATFRLTFGGELHLESFDFPFAKSEAPTQTVEDGRLTGDFWMEMRYWFDTPSAFVPFRDGRIVEDRCEWKLRYQTLTGTVRRVLRGGLLVDVGFSCFMPRSLVHPELLDDLEELVNRDVECEIVAFMDEGRDFILRPIQFLPIRPPRTSTHGTP